MSAQSVLKLNVAQVRCDPQVRKVFKPQVITAMAASMKSCGQIQPIVVREVAGEYILLDGQQRLLAANELGMATINAVVSDDASEGGIPVACKQLVANAQREDLNPIEQAQALQQILSETRWPLAKVAETIGFAPARVSRLLPLLSLSELVQDAISDGRIPASAGYELSKITDPTQKQQLTEQLLAGTLTRDGLSGIVKSSRRSRQSSDAPASDRISAPLDAETSIALTSPKLTLDRAIELTETWLASLRKARQQGISLKTLVATLRDRTKANCQANAKPMKDSSSARQ